MDVRYMYVRYIERCEVESAIAYLVFTIGVDNSSGSQASPTMPVYHEAMKLEMFPQHKYKFEGNIIIPIYGHDKVLVFFFRHIYIMHGISL